VDIPKNNYFYGDVYSANWIVDSIRAKQLLDASNYLEFVNEEKNIKRLEFNCEKVLYTIREGLKIFELALANKGSNSGSSFWLKIEREKIIARRTGDSMRAFWKLHRDKGIEKFLHEACDEKSNVRYSHVVKILPIVCTQNTNYAQQQEARMFERAGHKIVHVPGKAAITYNAHLGAETEKKASATLNQIFSAMEQIKPEIRQSQEAADEDVEMVKEKSDPAFIEERSQ